ncbi:hypothetical protein B7494_g4480 [Chlorociboria aeruginascens]|nr:hypothetical protein B7494_g4480 [Chlorociboria aeruginascens]
MAFLLAPYNNSMRLGQGFNSFTQQICIDDAVVIDPERAENVITNDGGTMRILVQSMGKPSAWSRQKEIVTDSRAKKIEVDEKEPPTKIEAAPPRKTGQRMAERASKTEQVDKPAAKKDEEDKEEDDDDEPAAATDENEKEEKEVEDSTEDQTEEDELKDDKESDGLVEVNKDDADENGADEDDVPSKEEDREPTEESEEKTEVVMMQKKKQLMKEEKERELEERRLRREREKEQREDEKERKAEEKRKREETKKLVEWGASTVGYTPAELEAMKHKIKFEERFNGMLENKTDYEFDPTAPRGPSQVVTYTSRFVDKLSDITDDMNISGSLSIKAGKFGGSGRGAFIDSDKFKESDLNFYISVKVVNQTINFKDALEYNRIRSVDSGDSAKFREVFGDCFISGFQEGGEFNAVVSMKILNKAKKTDIKAEAKVAFTAGPMAVEAEANVNIAKENIETNTETTIQVSWSGGGHIKPREQQWDIKSLMQAAARFPDLVAECPQRTYAILTKYDTLRSFVKLQPAAYTKLQYENAQIYTNAMMDSYMSYKSLYTRLGSDVFSIQNKSKEIKAWPEGQTTTGGAPSDASKALVSSTPKTPKTVTIIGTNEYSDETKVFPATITGLEAAKKEIRRQMNLIVNEVDVIEQDPKKATDEEHIEPYQSVTAFEERIPKVEATVMPTTKAPLGGKRIMAKTQTAEDLKKEEEEEAAATEAVPILSGTGVTQEEQGVLDLLVTQRSDLSKNLRVTAPIGSETKGKPFNNLEFLQPDWMITLIRVEIFEGAIVAFWVYYDNGLIITRGKTRNGRMIELCGFQPGERIIAATVTVGRGPKDATDPRLISLLLFTNRGRQLRGQAEKCSYNAAAKTHTRDGIDYHDVTIQIFDAPLHEATIKGFWGRSDDSGILRLGIIWGDIMKSYEEPFASKTQTDTLIRYATSFEEAETTLQDLSKLRTEHAILLEKKNSLDAESQDFKAKYNSTLSELRAANEVSARTNAEKAEFQRQLLTWGGRPAGYRRGRMEIHFIEYGGDLIWDEGVASRMLGFAERREPWEVNDPIFNRDPWPGVQKSCSILYRYDGQGEMKCLAGRQYQRVMFD